MTEEKQLSELNNLQNEVLLYAQCGLNRNVPDKESLFADFV